MKIAIYGAGNEGKRIFNEIRNNECGKVSVAFWIDNFVEKQEICGLPVYTEENFLSAHKSDEIDAVVVAIAQPRIAQEVTISLLLQGYDKVYLACQKAPQYPVSPLQFDTCLGPGIRLYKEIKPILRYIHISVTNSCNLNCKKCLNFSNLVVEKNFLDLIKFESYLKQLKKKFDKILNFNLLGGEPLLNPQLDVYISLIRKYFVGTRIGILTNGLLLTKIPEKLIDTMTSCQAFFSIAQYPPTQKKLKEIVDFLERKQIDYVITPAVTQFEKMISLKEENGEKAFAKRLQNQRDCECHTIDDGRIYLCMSIPRLYAMQDYFDIHIEEDELKNSSIDLMSDEMDGWEMLQCLRRPVSLCRFCSSEDVWEPWETGYPQKGDWIVD